MKKRLLILLATALAIVFSTAPISAAEQASKDIVAYEQETCSHISENNESFVISFESDASDSLTKEERAEIEAAVIEVFMNGLKSQEEQVKADVTEEEIIERLDSLSEYFMQSAEDSEFYITYENPSHYIKLSKLYCR